MTTKAKADLLRSLHVHGGLVEVDVRAAPVNAGLPLEGGSLDDLRAARGARVSVGPQLYRSALDHLRADLEPLLVSRGSTA